MCYSALYSLLCTRSRRQRDSYNKIYYGETRLDRRARWIMSTNNTTDNCHHWLLYYCVKSATVTPAKWLRSCPVLKEQGNFGGYPGGGGGGGAKLSLRYFHMYAYWACAAARNPHFQPWISVPEHIIFTNYQKNGSHIIRSGASPFYVFWRKWFAGDHHFQNFFNFNPFIASHGRLSPKANKSFGSAAG